MRVEIDSRIPKMWENVSSAIQLMLMDVANVIQNSAKQNAPYLTGTLRKSINTDFNKIQRGTAIVWSPVKYARVREYVNNKNPHTKYYLRRWYSENEMKIQKIVKDALNKQMK